MPNHITNPKFWNTVESLLVAKLEALQLPLASPKAVQAIDSFRKSLAQQDCLDIVYHYGPEDAAESIKRSFVFWDSVIEHLVSSNGFLERHATNVVTRLIKTLTWDYDYDLVRLYNTPPSKVADDISNGAFTALIEAATLGRPGLLEDDARLPTTDFDSDTFAHTLTNTILTRAYVMFQSLADDEGILKSRSLAAKLNIENPQWLPGLLTTHLENAARKINATLPWERLYDEQGRRYWICNPEVAQQIAESMKQEAANRHITIGIQRNLAI